MHERKRTKLRKVGGSYYLLLPKALLSAFDCDGDVEYRVLGEELRIRVIQRKDPELETAVKAAYADFLKRQRAHDPQCDDELLETIDDE